MNKEWSELNKTMQQQIKKQDTFNQGMNTLLLMRSKMMKEIHNFKDKLTQ